MKDRSNPNTKPAVEAPPDEVALRERIEKRAYHIWLARGGGHGDHVHHWLQAESEVLKSIQQEQEEQSAARKTKPAPKQRSTQISNDALPAI